MSALTSVFNFLYVYIRLFSAKLFGTSVRLESFQGGSYEIAKGIFDSFGFGVNSISFSCEPVLLLIIGVFVVGALIGLIQRLIR